MSSQRPSRQAKHMRQHSVRSRSGTAWRCSVPRDGPTYLPPGSRHTDEGWGTLYRITDETEVSRGVDRIFRISVVVKGIDGALEIIGGIVLVAVSHEAINSL